MQIYFFSGQIILYTTNICGSSLASPSFCRMYFEASEFIEDVCPINKSARPDIILEADAKSTLERKSSTMLDLVFFVIPSTFRSKAFTS